MALSYIEQMDFSGGMNRRDHPALLGGNEVYDLQDAVIDGAKRLRRRGPITFLPGGSTINFPASQYESATWGWQIIGAGAHSYSKGRRGIFAVGSTCLYSDAHVPATRIWFVPYVGSGSYGSPMVVATFMGYQSANASVCPAISKPASTSNNAQANLSIVTCEAGTIVFEVFRDEPDAAGPHQFNSHQIVGSDSYWFQGTIIAQAESNYDSDDGDYTQDTGSGGCVLRRYFETSPGWEAATSKRNWLGPRNFTACATVGLYSFLAGGDDQPQHVFWSRREDGTKWRRADKELFSDRSNSPIKALAELQGNLCVIKERAVMVMAVTPNPADFSVSTRARVGTVDGGSVAAYKEGVIFAGRTGIWRFDGYEASELSAKIAPLWRSAMQSYSPDWAVVGGVTDDYYLVSVLNDDRELVLSLAINLVTGAWSRLTNTRVSAFSGTATGDRNTIVGFTYPDVDGDNKRSFLLNMSSMFSLSTGTDQKVTDTERDGIEPKAGPHFELTTGAYTAQDQFRNKVWRKVELAYRALVSSYSTLELAVYVSEGTNPETTIHEIGGLVPTQKENKRLFRIGRRTRALVVKVVDSSRDVAPYGSSFSSVTLTGLRLGFRPTRPSRADKSEDA